jgi:ABC-type transporter Mla MlaB component
VTDRLVVFGGLDIEARRVLIASAAAVIGTADECIELDCSQIDVLDDPTMGMLVMIARNAQRQGLHVVLDMTSVRVRHDLDEAGVSYLFSWPA